MKDFPLVIFLRVNKFLNPKIKYIINIFITIYMVRFQSGVDFQFLTEALGMLAGFGTGVGMVWPAAGDWLILICLGFIWRGKKRTSQLILITRISKGGICPRNNCWFNFHPIGEAFHLQQTVDNTQHKAPLSPQIPNEMQQSVPGNVIHKKSKCEWWKHLTSSFYFHLSAITFRG